MNFLALQFVTNYMVIICKKTLRQVPVVRKTFVLTPKLLKNLLPSQTPDIKKSHSS